MFAGLLAAHGYHTAAGVLSAERYGVPQTRKRAFLIASLDGPVQTAGADAPLLQPPPRARYPRTRLAFCRGSAWPRRSAGRRAIGSDSRAATTRRATASQG